jgi:cytochrome c oxidase subunit II
LCVAPVLAGCEGALSSLDPAGPAAQSIAGVWWVMMAGSLVILALMMGLILFPFWKRHQPREVPETLWLWGGGLGFPLVVLAALLAWGLPSGQSMLAGRETPVHTVEAEAYQWGWNFRYPGEDGVTPEVLHIPAGEPVDVAITSLDVIHAFWVPRLAGKVDAIPGTTNTLRILAPEPGIYEGMCAEFCGLEHATMRFRVVAHASDEYESALDAALAGQEQP